MITIGCNCRKKKSRTLMERRADLSAAQGSGTFATSRVTREPSTAGSAGGPSATTTDTAAKTSDTKADTVTTVE